MANESLRAMRRWCAGGLLVVCLLVATTGLAGQRVTEEKPRPGTVAEWLPLAEGGDPEAECNLGVAYLNGNNVAQDFTTGLSWLVRAADQGFGYAHYVLADVYSRGYAGVPISDEKAYYYAVLAAASSNLAKKYQEKALKIRDASAKKLTPVQVRRLQATAAQAPVDAAQTPVDAAVSGS